MTDLHRGHWKKTLTDYWTKAHEVKVQEKMSWNKFMN